ncbi:MAG: radical SAM protein [Desulfovibrionales bacterium]
MEYIGRIIRPPSEADSILLQVTVGCSHNKCDFCGAYKDKRFAIKTDEQILQDIVFAREHCRRQRRVFLCDGDGLIIPQKRLLFILDAIRQELPWVTRIGTYGNAKAVQRKTPEELRELREHGLGIVYMGLESGDDEILARMHKWGASRDMIREAEKLRQAGIKLNVTVLLGLGGIRESQRHARNTGRVLSAIDPEQAAALTLMLIPGTPLHGAWEQGNFQLPDSMTILRELRTMLEHTTLSRGLFLSNHASNYLPLKIRLPRDKAAALERIDQALAGKLFLTPETSRRL